jgi:hypothetical protein
MEDVKGKATEAAGDAMAKVNEMVDEIKTALAVFEKFGFRAGKLKMDFTPIASVATSISGSLDKVEKESLEKLIEEHQENKLLCGMLKALIKAKQVRDRVEVDYFTGTTLNVQMGIPPKISFDLKEIK